MFRGQKEKAGRSALIVLLITMLNVMLVATFAWMQHHSVSDGTYLKPGAPVWTHEGVIVTRLDDRPEGLRTGDVVLSVNGSSLESWVEAALQCVPVLCAKKQPLEWREGQQVIYTVLRDGERLELPIQLERHPLLAAIGQNWGTLVFVILDVLIFAFVFYKRPYEPAVQVLLVSTASLLGSMAWLMGLHVGNIVTGSGFWLYRLATEGVYLLTWIGSLHFTLIFPKPHAVVRRYPWIIPVLYPLGFAAYFTSFFLIRQDSINVLAWLGRMSQAQATVILPYLLIGMIAVVTNYRAQQDPVSRQQIRIIVFALSVILALGIMLWLFPQLILEEAVFSSHTMAIVGLLLPVALAVSILRYRLWDIDILINRTLVYFSLTALVVGIYVLIVGSAGTLLQSGSNLSVSLFATGVVAVSFQPMRERLQRMVNRLMYGERDEPYAVLKRLSQRLEVVVASEQVLPTIVETVALALKIPYAAIVLQDEENFRVAVSYPPSAPVEKDPGADVQVWPLVYQSETVGQFILAPRGRGEPFSQADQQLLETIARQASVAAYNVRITRDLIHSRERLVTTREEERRRLRRDLHDGLGPVLAAMSFGLDAVYNLAESDPTAVREVVAQLKEQAQGALSDIRRIAYGLRPPALDELGLVGALKEHIASHHAQDLQIVLEAPDRLPPLPAAVEVAAYRIALEAITNVIRHANASHCVVRLWLDEQLCLEVSDDGRGLPAVVRAGVGMASMRERAEELGGQLNFKPMIDGSGTIVVAQLPLPKNYQKEDRTNSWNSFES